MIVSTGLTVPVAVTARVTAPRVTSAVVYRTVPLLPDNHQARPTAATMSANGAPMTQGLRRCERAEAADSSFGTSVTGADGSKRDASSAAGLFMRKQIA